MTKVFVTNSKARYEFYIEDKLEAGIALTGSEVKSIRAKQSNINDAFINIKKGELFLINAHIGKYTKATIQNHEEKRYRKLLLHKREINKIIGKLKISGYTSVPLKLYLNNKNRIKVEIAIVRGKQLHDKRTAIKEREWNREKARIIKTNGIS